MVPETVHFLLEPSLPCPLVPIKVSSSCTALRSCFLLLDRVLLDTGIITVNDIFKTYSVELWFSLIVCIWRRL